MHIQANHKKGKCFQGLIRFLPALSMGIFLIVPPPFAFAQTAKMPLLAVVKPMSANGGTTISIAASETKSPPFFKQDEKKIMKIWVTAYSSSPDETDDTPFTTASGKTVREGIVATNLLPFGTRIMIPSLFGNKVFVVQDRMHSRKKNNVDIWMPSKREALRFGITYADIFILETPHDALSSAL